MSAQIEMTGVTYNANHRRVLDGVSLKIAAGEFVSIIGPSGCGKTTLLKIMCGILAPTLGTVASQGRPLEDLSPAEHRILMVWQSLALFPHLNVYQNIAFGLSLQGIPRSLRNCRVRRVLELVELSGLESRRIGQLSGGEKQRVALARVLVLEPNVLLLDEPFANLHPDLRFRLAALIRTAHRGLGTTMVMVTHDQMEARTLSDRIVIMRQGTVEQVGSAEHVFSHPTTEFAARFIGGRNVLRGIVTRIDRHQIEVLVGEKILTAKGEYGDAIFKVNDKVAYVIDERALSVGSRGDNTLTASINGITNDGLVEIFELLSPEIGILRGRHLLRGASISGRLFSTTTVSWSEHDAYLLPISNS